jgi:uncharacterized protein (TIGR02466 family)
MIFVDAKERGEIVYIGEGDGRRVLLFFGTPVLTVQWPDCEEVNRQLAELILALERTQPSVKQSNRGGWQSPKSFHTIEHPAVRQLLAWIDVGVYLLSAELAGEQAVDQFPEKWRTSAWANVNRVGHFNGIHFHNGGFWSGVYYVAIENGSPAANGGDAGAGAIGFRSPSQAGMIASNIYAPPELQRAFQQEISLPPMPGLMLIFPSWLEHWVNPYAGSEPRISIAFDISYPAPR